MNIRNKDGHLEYAYSNLLKPGIHTNENIKEKIDLPEREIIQSTVNQMKHG
jgi:hypothetical protein